MTTANSELKRRAKERGVFIYEIAERLNIIDTAFSRKLRYELPEDEKKKILTLIDEIAAAKQAQKCS